MVFMPCWGGQYSNQLDQKRRGEVRLFRKLFRWKDEDDVFSHQPPLFRLMCLAGGPDVSAPRVSHFSKHQGRAEVTFVDMEAAALVATVL